MRQVTLTNRSRRTRTLVLSERENGALPHLQGQTAGRLIAAVDKVSGETRRKALEVRCPPSIRLAPGETSKPLPDTVLNLPQVKALTKKTTGRRPVLAVAHIVKA